MRRACPHSRTLRLVLVAVLLVACVVAGFAWCFVPSADATARFARIASPIDFDGDGVDDYADLLAGAKAEAGATPAYDDGYYAGGYPPEGRGACTDTIWCAFASAGYDLKAMVDADIAENSEAYAGAVGSPDPNIDFRRVPVLQVFLSRYVQGRSCDVDDVADWQPGDIVVFGDGRHIGIVSDLRDASGTPFIIHTMGQPFREENYLSYPWAMRPTARYRFDASSISEQVFVPWGSR